MSSAASHPGRFIVLDGVDGCGKSTQAGLLVRALRSAVGVEVQHLREPGSTTLGEGLRARLGALDGVTVHDRGRERCGIVTFSVRGHPAAAVQAALRARDVETSVSEVGSYRLGMAHRGLEAVVRASPHAFNTTAELDRCAAAVAELTAP